MSSKVSAPFEHAFVFFAIRYPTLTALSHLAPLFTYCFLQALMCPMTIQPMPLQETCSPLRLETPVATHRADVVHFQIVDLLGLVFWHVQYLCRFLFIYIRLGPLISDEYAESWNQVDDNTEVSVPWIHKRE